MSEEELKRELAKKELQNMFRGYETIEVLKDQLDHLKKYIEILTNENSKLKKQNSIHASNEKLFLQKIKKLEISNFDLKKNKHTDIYIENVYINN
ncbi:MAG: hypothetical protein WC136_04940 [Sphaerochaeta sp.]